MFIMRLILQFYTNLQFNHMYNELKNQPQIISEVLRTSQNPNTITFTIDFGLGFKNRATLKKLMNDPRQLKSTLFEIKLEKPLPVLSSSYISSDSDTIQRMSSIIKIKIGGSQGEELTSLKEEYGCHIGKIVESIKHRYQYMMLIQYCESIQDQLMLHCKASIPQKFHNSSWRQTEDRPRVKNIDSFIVQ